MLKIATPYILLALLLSSCSHSKLSPNVVEPSSSASQNQVSNSAPTLFSLVDGVSKTDPASNETPLPIIALNKKPKIFNVPSKQSSAPFNLALKSVESYINHWLRRSSEVPLIGLKPPEITALPEARVFSKNEFETTKQFNTRLAQAKSEYRKILDNIKQEYLDEVSTYNAAIKSYNNEIKWEQKERQEQAKSMRIRLLNTAINEVLGTPKLANLEYNADQEFFNGKVVSENSMISYDILIPVAINDAKAFKENAEKAVVSIKMSLEGRIKPIDFRIDSAIGSYTASLEAKDGIKATMFEQRSVGVENIDLSNVVIDKANSLEVDDNISSNKKYFGKLF